MYICVLILFEIIPKGGQSLPPRLALRTTSLVFLDSPMPQVLLQGLHSDQCPTLQFIGPPR